MTHPLTPREKVDVREIALAAMTEMRRSGESYEMCARWISERVNTALASGSGDHSGGVTDMIGSGDHAPAAWRVKDFADGWIVCGSEQTAADLAAAMSGATVQPLYGPELLAEIAALRARMETVLDGECPCCVLTRARCADTVARIEIDRTEAERKLAEAVGIASKLSAAISWLDYPFIDNNTAEPELRSRVGFMMKDAEQPRAMLSKEAERG